MNKLIQKVKWNLDGSNTDMYVYGEADFEANKSMQEPLEKLYQYENQPNMREAIRLLRSLVIQVPILEIKSGGRQTKTRLALLFPKVKRSSLKTTS